ncbi:hypothetical protein [Halosegnis longus]|uniref:hypothetical protein n=1 Tax=Halosegnis longus TaxID=2216012 RepID=UPI00129EF1A4|nr:hypothetical protein [Halosegnis longus]
MTDPEAMSRAELETAVTDLRNDIEYLERSLQHLEEFVLGEYNPAIAQQELDGTPLFKVAQQSGEATETVAFDAREAMVDAHIELQDLKAGRANGSQSEIRAARLLQAFIRERSPDHQLTGVSPTTGGRLEMGADDARRLLREHDLATNTGMSTIIARAMDALVRNSEYGPDATPLFRHKSEHGHVVSVDQERWNEYLEAVQAALDGVTVAVPDTGDAADDPTMGEATDEQPAPNDEPAQLPAAPPRATNTVVSCSDESVFGGETDD